MKLKLTFFIIVLLTALVIAQNIEYPIPELGSCSSQQECQEYCEIEEHRSECLDFAEENGLMTEEEIENARVVYPLMESDKGPGGCGGFDECSNYCKKEENFEECLEFAEENNLISGKQAELARETKGGGPGGCRGPQECAEYCTKDENIPECAEFAYNHGIINEEEYTTLKNTRGKGPNGCEGEECKEYCEKHKFECLKWALANNVTTLEEELEGKSEREKCQMRCFIENNFDPEKCQRTKGKKEIPHETCLLCEQQCRTKQGDKDKEIKESSKEETCFKECLLDKGVEYKDIIKENVGKETRIECSKKCGLKSSKEKGKDLEKKKEDMPEKEGKPEMKDKEPPPEEHDKEPSSDDEQEDSEESEEESNETNTEESKPSEEETNSNEDENTETSEEETEESESSEEETTDTTTDETTEDSETQSGITGEAIKDTKFSLIEFIKKLFS